MKKNIQGSEIIILDDSSNRPPYRADRFCWKPGDLVVTMPYISGKPYYRLYASPMAHFLDKKTYKYLGGFTDDERAGRYAKDIRISGNFRKQDLVLLEFDSESEDPEDGEIVMILSVTGEYLRPEEWC